MESSEQSLLLLMRIWADLTGSDLFREGWCVIVNQVAEIDRQRGRKGSIQALSFGEEGSKEADEKSSVHFETLGS